jgi:sugar (pentulose or hexulose) kinase
MSKYLGIDLGTQSLKVIVYDAESHAIESSASSELQLNSRTDGTREQQADWWIRALHLAMQQVGEQDKTGATIEAVSCLLRITDLFSRAYKGILSQFGPRSRFMFMPCSA